MGVLARVGAVSLPVLLGFVTPAAADAARRPLLDELYDVEVTRVGGSVYATVQDADGYLWVGGDTGASRFDGLDLVTHGPPRDAAFASPQVFRLMPGGGAVVWAGLAGGTFRVDHAADGGAVLAIEERSQVGPLLRYDGRSWSTVAVADPIWALATDGDVVWAGGEHGLHRIAPGPADVAELAGAHVLALLRARDGTLWVGTTAGLVAGRAGRFEPATIAGTDRTPAVLALAQDGRGTVWAGTAEGLARVERGALVPVPAATASLAYPWVESLATTPDGALWAATRSGLVRLVDERRDVFRRDNGLPDEQILSLSTDRSGALWVGTRHGGLVRVGPRAVRNIGVDEGLPGREAHAVLRARDGTMWISADGGIMRVAPEGTREVARRARELPDRTPTALAEDRDGTLWAATDLPTELWCRPPRGPWTRVTFDAVGRRPARARVLAFQRSALWIGFDLGAARADAVTCAPGGRVVAARWFADEGDCRGAVVDLAADSSGAMWAAVDGAGLARLSPGATTCFGARAGLPSASVGSVLVDGVGGVWAGVLFDGGLQLLRDGRFAGLREGTGLTCDSIAKLVDDGAGHLWAACASGATRVGRDDALAVATGRSSEALPIGYGAGEGMRSPRTAIGAQPVAAVDARGALWVATDAGVSVLEPPEREPHGSRVVPEISSIELGERTFAPGDEVTAPAGALRVHYTAPALWPKHRRAFRYRLDPLDRAWEITVDRRVATYPRLEPGSYTFVVEAGDGRGGFSPVERSVRIRVLPPWHRRPALLGLAAFAIGLAAFAIARLRTRRLRDRVRLVEEERARVARDLHDGLGQSLAAVTLNLETATLAAAQSASPALRTAIATARAFLRHSREEVRRAIWNLRAREAPRPVQEALAASLDELRRRGPDGPTIRLAIAPDLPPAAAQVDAELTTMITEAVWNAIRHARASRVDVRLAREGRGTIVATITDDGVGFTLDLEKLVLLGHFGLFGIAERARLLGGSWDVSRSPTGGTVVTIAVPAQPAKETLAR